MLTRAKRCRCLQDDEARAAMPMTKGRKVSVFCAAWGLLVTPVFVCWGGRDQTERTEK